LQVAAIRCAKQTDGIRGDLRILAVELLDCTGQSALEDRLLTLLASQWHDFLGRHNRIPKDMHVVRDSREQALFDVGYLRIVRDTDDVPRDPRIDVVLW